MSSAKVGDGGARSWKDGTQSLPSEFILGPPFRFVLVRSPPWVLAAPTTPLQTSNYILLKSQSLLYI
jgi:hypothetical protein